MSQCVAVLAGDRAHRKSRSVVVISDALTECVER